MILTGLLPYVRLIDSVGLDREIHHSEVDGPSALLHWMAHGGFPPETMAVSQLVVGRLSEPTRSLGHDWNRSVALAACSYALDLATHVLQDPNGIPRGVPFTLSCCDCDSGHPESYEEAVAVGWINIRFVPQSVAENFLGMCPECQLLGEENSSSAAG